jgi:Domain of unknown function (DUF4956)
VNLYIDYTNVIRDVIIDLVSLYFFSYRILYKRYLNKELFVTCSLFNIFLLLVIMAIVRTNFNIALGFGLFALLSLVTLRSATFSKAEMAYVFGSVSLAVINGAGITDLIFVLICNTIIILAAMVISAWSLEHSANIMQVDNVKNMSMTLDRIDTDALNNRSRMKEKLQLIYNIDVINFTVLKVDYVKDLMDIDLVYRVGPDDASNAADQDRLLLAGASHAANGGLPHQITNGTDHAANGALPHMEVNGSGLPSDEGRIGNGALPGRGPTSGAR